MLALSEQGIREITIHNSGMASGFTLRLLVLTLSECGISETIIHNRQTAESCVGFCVFPRKRGDIQCYTIC